MAGIIASDDDGEGAMQREPANEPAKKKGPTPEQMHVTETRKQLAKDICFILNLDIDKLSTADKGKIKLHLQKVADLHKYEGVTTVAKLSGLQLEAIANTIADEATQTREAMD